MNGSACHFHSPQANDALLIRLSGSFSDVKKHIISRYTKQIRDTVDLWTLYDVTSSSPEERLRTSNALKDLQRGLESSFSVFLYETEFLYRVFPTAHQRLKAAEVNRYIHDISILSWWRVCGRHNWGDNSRVDPTEITPKNVWVIEADAGFSGDVTFFLDFYKDKGYDFIASTVGNVLKGESFLSRLKIKAESWLKVAHEKTQDFSTFPADRLYAKNDFVNRFSSRLLYHLEVLTVANDIFFGEMFASTVCAGMYSSWCTYHSFNNDGFEGEVLVFNGNVSAESWNKYNHEPEYQNRWYHAVSEFKEHKWEEEYKWG